MKTLFILFFLFFFILFIYFKKKQDVRPATRQAAGGGSRNPDVHSRRPSRSQVSTEEIHGTRPVVVVYSRVEGSTQGRRGAGEMNSGGEQGPDGGTRGTAVGGHRGVHVQGRGGVCPPDASSRGAGTAQAAPTGIERLERGDGEAGGGGMPDTHGNARQEVHVVGLPTDMGRSDGGVRGSTARAQRDQGNCWGVRRRSRWSHRSRGGESSSRRR